MRVYYNEIDPYCCAWLRNLIDAGHLPAGDIDRRSIEDVRPDDLRGYVQCHFFAGIGGWAYAIELAGWPLDRPCWTGSCPCQPFSQAGKGLGFADERHLWPAWFHLIRECRPAIVFGEQVEAAIRHGWLDLVSDDMEGIEYAIATFSLGAHSVKAPHHRQRLFFVADTAINGRERIQRCVTPQIPQDRTLEALDAWHGTGNPFEHWFEFLAGADVRRMDDGLSSNMAVRPSLRCFGNAIVPQVAAEFVRACL